MMLKVYSSEKIRELINNKLMKSNRPQRILVVGGRGCGKTQYMKKLAEEAAKLGPVKVMRANEHYIDAFRYALMNKSKINLYYPVESEFDISYSEHIAKMAMCRIADREREAAASGKITAEMLMTAVEKMSSYQPPCPSFEQIFFFLTDEMAKYASERYSGVCLATQSGRRFRNGEIIND